MNDAIRFASLLDAASELLGERAEFVRSLTGGAHAETVVIRVQGRELVARRFPTGDDAVAQEVRVLARIGALGSSVPTLVAYRLEPEPVIVTTKVEGSIPAPTLAAEMMAAELGRALARVHALDPSGLRRHRKGAPEGTTAMARAAQRQQLDANSSPDVFVHGDFWCGNALWQGVRLTGIVDWSDAHAGPRGFDVAWCRQDLVLLGAPDAAAVLVDSYETASGVTVGDLHAWDLIVGARAEPVVETWATNYAGIGRADLTPSVLRARLDEWNAALLRTS